MNTSFRFAQRAVKTSQKSGCFNFRATTSTTESFAQKFNKRSTSTSTSSTSSSIPSFGSFASFSSSYKFTYTIALKSTLRSTKTISASGFPLVEVLCFIDPDDDDDR
ncbi:hypothetical protein ACTFIZ_001685 [Dictyostelium cf. discoideum]